MVVEIPKILEPRLRFELRLNRYDGPVLATNTTPAGSRPNPWMNRNICWSRHEESNPDRILTRDAFCR